MMLQIADAVFFGEDIFESSGLYKTRSVQSRDVKERKGERNKIRPKALQWIFLLGIEMGKIK